MWAFKHENKKYTTISIYVILTAAAIFGLGLVFQHATELITSILEGTSWLLKVVKPVIIGFVLAYILDPVVDLFQKWLQKIKYFDRHKKRARGISILVTYLLVVFFVVAIISLLVFSVTDQLRVANFEDIIAVCNSYIGSVNEMYGQILKWLNELNIQSDELSAYVKEISGHLIEYLKAVLEGAALSVGNISGFMTTAVFAIIISIYFLVDGKMIGCFLRKVFRAFFNDKINDWAGTVISDADTVFSGYMRGQLTDAFVMMILISLSLSLLGVKFSVLIGVMAGIGNLIPYCGPVVAYGLTAIVCLLNGDIKKLVIGIIVLFVIQTIDGNLIGPKLLSQSIDIHPLLVIVSLIFGSAVGGFLGMLLAVPVGAFLKVRFVSYLDRKLELKGIKVEPYSEPVDGDGFGRERKENTEEKKEKNRTDKKEK
ncbi:MAG: AI-2E family transporter [Clostridiales bacterium]|nr:AI-2E family transporter [Clostridiales bacterium]